MAANFDYLYDSTPSARDPRLPGSMSASSIFSSLSSSATTPITQTSGSTPRGYPQGPTGRETLGYPRDTGYETGYCGYPPSYRQKDGYESSLSVPSYPPDDYWGPSGDMPGHRNSAALPTGAYDRYERYPERYAERCPERYDPYFDRYAGALPLSRHPLDMAAYPRQYDATLYPRDLRYSRDLGRYPGAPIAAGRCAGHPDDRFESSFPPFYHPSSHPSFSAYPSAGPVSNRGLPSASVPNALHLTRGGALGVSRDVGTTPVAASSCQPLAHQSTGMPGNPMTRFLRFPQRTLFVRDLPYSCNSVTLEQFFQEQMSRHIASLSPDAPPELFVEEAHVCRNKEGRTQQVGYVLMPSLEIAHLALQVMQMKRFLGRDIRVVLFDPKSPAEGSTTGAMHVSFQSLSTELPLVTEADLREVCEQFGAIDHIAIRTHKFTTQGLQSGYGFVTFVEPDLHRYCIDQIRCLETTGKRFTFSWAAKLLPQQQQQQPPISGLKPLNPSHSLSSNAQTFQMFSQMDGNHNMMMKNSATNLHIVNDSNNNDAFFDLLKPNANFQALSNESSTDNIINKDKMNFHKMMNCEEKDLKIMWTGFPGKNNQKNEDLDAIIDDIGERTRVEN